MYNDCEIEKPKYPKESKVPKNKQEEIQKKYFENFKSKYKDLNNPFEGNVNTADNCRKWTCNVGYNNFLPDVEEFYNDILRKYTEETKPSKKGEGEGKIRIRVPNLIKV